MAYTELEIVTSGQTQRLATLKQVERELGTGEAEAAIVNDMIDQASEDIQNFLHRDLGQEEVKETWWTPPIAEYVGRQRSWVVYPQRIPLVSITEVRDKDDAVVSTDDYRIEGNRIRFFEDDTFVLDDPRWMLSIQYLAGYGLPGWDPPATPALPEIVTRATITTVQQLYEVLGGPGSELSRESLGDYAVAYGNAGRRLSAQVLDQIMPFRRMVYV